MTVPFCFYNADTAPAFHRDCIPVAWRSHTSSCDQLSTCSVSLAWGEKGAGPRTKMAARGRPSQGEGKSVLPHDDDPRSYPDALVQIDYVVIQHPDAAGRDGLTDRLGFVGAVDPV